MKGTHTCVLKRTYHIRYCLTWGVVLKKKLVFRITLNGWKWREETSTQPQWRAEWVLFPPLDGWRTRLIHGRLLLALFQFKASKPLKAKRRRAAQQHVHIYRRYHPGPKARATSYLRHNIYLSTKNTQKLCTLFKGYISARLQAWTNRIGPMETNFSFQSLNKAKNITRFNNK